MLVNCDHESDWPETFLKYYKGANLDVHYHLHNGYGASKKEDTVVMKTEQGRRDRPNYCRAWLRKGKCSRHPGSCTRFHPNKDYTVQVGGPGEVYPFRHDLDSDSPSAKKQKTEEEAEIKQIEVEKQQKEVEKKQKETVKKQKEAEKKQKETVKKQKEAEKKQKEAEKKQKEAEKKQKEAEKQREVEEEQKEVEEKH